MATVTGFDFVGLQVRDVERSAAFYTDIIGLKRAPGGPPGAAVFATDPIPFAVRVPSVDLDAVSDLGWGVALWLRADDAQEVYEQLTHMGVPIVTEPFDGPFGRTFAFTDPDGYTITVHDQG